MKRHTWLILCTCCLDVFHCYENIAIKKPAYQQSSFIPGNDIYAASNAVDGRRTNLKYNGGQCAVSASGQTATWWVNLTSIHSIHHITIYYLTNNKIWDSSSYFARSFLGFSVYISNTTNRLQGTLCFKDINFSASTIPAVFNTTCNLIGQYVIYYNERLNNVTYPADYSEFAESDLCEVEVYVCPRGFFGEGCADKCSDNCYGCNHINGLCDSGCKPGWRGDNCQEDCPRGFFGEGCADQCSDKCYGCNHINGLCDYGCKPGWRGDNCQEVCPWGFYGEGCSDQCSDNCYGCNHINGLCDSGCKPGWKGDNCQEACSYGFFGDDCAYTCIDTCAGCNNINGLCDYGCIPGWTGYFCNKVCPVGFFGQECAYRCNNTCKGCNNTNGLCDSGCNPGWKGDYCNEDCNKGSYGISCQDVCGQCRDVNQCLHINGTCLTGCSAGYQGTLCKETCNNGSFGNDCREHCERCRDNDCHHIHGTCLSGCIDGYQGDLCKTHCEKTFFGMNCSHKCNIRCLNQDCHHETGECVDNQKHNNLPTIIVLLGSIVAVAVLLITFLFWRTRSRTLKLRTTTNRDDYEAETSIQYLGQNRMQNLSTKCQKGNLEERRNLPRSLNMKCTHGKTSKTASNSNGFKDKNTFVNEKVHPGNQIDDVFQIKEHCSIDIDVTELGKVIEENMKNDDSGFQKEYASVLYGDQYPCKIGKHPENIAKNRFKTILPYDHSRITLERKCSDYINANYIDGIGQENEYIATQGPKQNTVNDFWVMVWQEKVAQIVMLTNLVEETKNKCIQYWPDLEASMDCDILTLRTTEERRYAYYVIRRLNMTHRQKRENRTVTHYHFTAWPDHGVPDPICLLLFHNHVARTKRTSYEGPTIVHCSAGIGRTGTYIAVDALYKESQRKNKINIAEYVKEMREKRMNMVQTCEQYKTIYLTLHEMLKAQTPIQNTTEFLQKLEAAKIDLPANDSLIRKEIQRLLTVRPQYTEADYKIASDYRDMSTSVLPLDNYVLFLTSSVSKRGNYINAISVPSFTNRDKFIITHYQNPADAVDFLRLITDHESEVVVCMDPLSSVESAEQWLPTITKPKSLRPFKIELQEENKAEIRCRKIRISSKGIEDKGWLVKFVEPLYSIILKESQTASQILGLVSLVEKIDTDNAITVVSRDGAAVCGVFCAVYNLIQQLTMDEEIDVFSAVRLLQTRRPELCNSLEEYELIYEALYRFIKSQKEEHIYYNQKT